MDRYFYLDRSYIVLPRFRVECSTGSGYNDIYSRPSGESEGGTRDIHTS